MLLNNVGGDKIAVHRPGGATLECIGGLVDTRVQGTVKPFLTMDVCFVNLIF